MITQIWSVEDDVDESLPLTSSGAVQVVDSIRALADRAKAQCQTDDDVHALLRESNLLRESLLAGITDHALLLRSLTSFVDHGGIVVLVHVLANCLAAPCQLQWAAYESFGQQGLMRTAHILEVICKEENRDVWRQVPPADQTSVISVLIHIVEATMQGRFVDMRMQDSYTILKTLQDLCCLDEHTAGVFLSCCGLSNLCAVISWPHAEMRHVRWAAVSFLKEIITLALPAARAADWAVAPDAVQAVSCLVEALHLYVSRGRSFLYDAGTEAVLDVLMHLSQSPSYLMIVTGVVEIHQAGGALFLGVGTKVRDASAKATATNLGLKCFPDGLDGQQPLECRRRSLRNLFWRSDPEQGYSALPTC